jgi:RNA polymerase sigma-70 factor (family 1)
LQSEENKVKPALPMALLIYTDQKLLSLIAKGNEKAFKVLYEEYFSRLSAYVFKFCKSTSLTEDVLQEVFMKLWVNRLALIDVEVPEAYILFIAKNTTIDWLRKLAGQTTLIVDLALVSQKEECGNEAEDKMSVDRLENLIATALSQLSGQKQKVFQLSKIEGLSHDEIASELHLSKSTVKNHLSETMKYIRSQIQFSVPLEV